MLVIATVAAATAVSIPARDTDHPVTAAVVYVIAILINGAVGGLSIGFLSAILSSFIYSCFVRYPVYAFGLSTIDDVVPILAFTVTAFVSGVLSGRLADRVRVAERARGQVEQLLRLSSELQRAITIEDIAGALVNVTRDSHKAREMFRAINLDWPWQEQSGETSPDRAQPLQPDDIDTGAALNLLRVVVDRRELLERQAMSEAALESERFKTALLSCVSHDLRTPLAAISTSVSGLTRYRDKLDSDTQSTMLATIEEQCDRLRDFVEHMLNLSRVDAGLSSDDLEMVEIDDLLRSAVQKMRHAYPARAINCMVGKEHMLSIAQPHLLGQVFVNILENAIRYSPPESVVDVRVRREQGEIMLQVTDRGPGISPQDLPHIFERFYRGNSAGGSGLGLGLSFSKAFVEFMGGSISVESPASDGVGTNVFIRLPEFIEEDIEVEDECKNPDR